MRTKYFKFLAYFAFLASLIYGFYHILKAFDFVKEAYIYTGVFALFFLNLSLLFSLCKFKKTKSYPKLLGIFAAFWAFLHFLNYFIFDRNSNFLRLFDDISHRLLEASGFFAFIIIFFMFLSSFRFFKRIEKIRKLGYVCLVLASYHYFLSPKVPMFWEWSALMLSLVYFMIRYLKFFKFKKA
ncbi:sulfite oxidase heme-binding subunit YedZ [Campylobacter coli]|nr:sulfite oxidase heme-binding subunit YedZ [Campylobacter coli]EAJ8854952.1 sulfite oxidase heme-binding subunit YedZ [Campylobacter coli]EAL4311165.1 ferric reductase [Campylobacter coli]ECS0828582.1 sulfite oxidase heme-binding subunit YedZ [Campylobacter coli]ECX4029589.1 sulfite oxidase heme-binding subunit YedZ [Campylobacter coli]